MFKKLIVLILIVFGFTFQSAVPQKVSAAPDGSWSLVTYSNSCSAHFVSTLVGHYDGHAWVDGRGEYTGILNLNVTTIPYSQDKSIPAEWYANGQITVNWKINAPDGSRSGSFTCGTNQVPDPDPTDTPDDGNNGGNDNEGNGNTPVSHPVNGTSVDVDTGNTVCNLYGQTAVFAPGTTGDGYGQFRAEDGSVYSVYFENGNCYEVNNTQAKPVIVQEYANCETKILATKKVNGQVDRGDIMMISSPTNTQSAINLTEELGIGEDFDAAPSQNGCWMVFSRIGESQTIATLWTSDFEKSREIKFHDQPIEGIESSVGPNDVIVFVQSGELKLTDRSGSFIRDLSVTGSNPVFYGDDIMFITTSGNIGLVNQYGKLQPVSWNLQANNLWSATPNEIFFAMPSGSAVNRLTPEVALSVVPEATEIAHLSGTQQALTIRGGQLCYIPDLRNANVSQMVTNVEGVNWGDITWQ